MGLWGNERREEKKKKMKKKKKARDKNGTKRLLIYRLIGLESERNSKREKETVRERNKII